MMCARSHGKCWFIFKFLFKVKILAILTKFWHTILTIFELRNWCFWTAVLEKTLESPLDCKEIKQVNPKGNQSWIFIGRTNAESETPILWPSDAKNWLIGKDPDWCWERLKVGGEGDDREWDGWMASLTRWTWVWAGSRSWYCTRRPGVLQSMGSQRARQDCVIELSLLLPLLQWKGLAPSLKWEMHGSQLTTQKSKSEGTTLQLWLGDGAA